MKITCLIIFLLFPFLIYGQEVNSELKNEINKIDSIIQLTNNTETNFSEGIAEGPIIYQSMFKKNGGWEAYFLYKNLNDNPPIRIKYNEGGNKAYKKFEFYYQNGKLIFAKLNVNFYRGKEKNNPIEKRFYFKNSKLISESNSKSENYGEDYIMQTENYVRKMIYE